jgi:hypothetical protein
VHAAKARSGDIEPWHCAAISAVNAAKIDDRKDMRQRTDQIVKQQDARKEAAEAAHRITRPSREPHGR